MVVPRAQRKSKPFARSASIRRVRQIGGSDGLLAAAYQHARFHVYPFLYEGFGFPPLEAMVLRCAVACSSTSSMPEVAGDMAVTFNLRSSDDLAVAMITLVEDETVRQHFRSTGAQRARHFIWQRCAASTRSPYLRTR